MPDDLGGGASRSTDPAAGTSTATDVSLREYLTALIRAERERVDARFKAIENAVSTAFSESQKAITKAEIATEKRFEGVNEFRLTLSDQAAQFVTRDTLAATAEKLQAGIDRNHTDQEQFARRLETMSGETQGSRITKASLYSALGLGIGAISVIVVIVTYISNH